MEAKLKNNKTKNSKITIEQELEFAKMNYSALKEKNDKLLKALIYLEWYAEQQEIGTENPRTNRIVKETSREKYFREQSKYIYAEFKNMIHDELSKYFKGVQSDTFRYISQEEMVYMSFGGPIFYK